MVLARHAVKRFSTRYSWKRFTLRQHVVPLCLKVKKTTTYRDLVDELIEMTRIRDALYLDSIPTPSTLCKAFDRLEMAVWRVLLNVSLTDLPLSGVTGIDASGFERAHASTHYTKRTDLIIQQLKITLLVDTATNAVLDIHVTTTRKQDTKIAPQVVKRNGQSIAVLTGDKGYDDQKLRQLARDHDIRPLIKHREFHTPQGLEYTVGQRSLPQTEHERDSQHGDQTEIRCIRPVTSLVEAVPRTRYQVHRSQSGAKPRYFTRGARLSVILRGRDF